MENVLQKILEENQIESSKIVDKTLAKLTNDVKIEELSQTILNAKQQILDLFTMYRDKEEFKEAHFSIPNGNVKKEYNYTFDMFSFPSIKIRDVKNLDWVGLQFDAQTASIFGTPTTANSFEIEIEFFRIDDENLTIDSKRIPFIVNADPKDLWLNKPSPKDSRFPKEEEATFGAKFLDKKIVVASKRGRSHAHEGTHRDDDFLVKNLPNNWAIVAVADGAGSAQYARKGSEFVVNRIVENFNSDSLLGELNDYVALYFAGNNDNDEAKIAIKTKVVNILYKNVRALYADLEKFAISESIQLKDLHTTLIFTLVKKFEFGYVVLSFGVGDCPINILEDNDTKVKLLNFLDVGEFGGGTRFITMDEIFRRPDMVNRFGVNCFKDFSKLFLMTDGIYDPKFVVESKLENIETWKNFLRDLDGENEDQAKVDFQNDEDIQNQLSHWMDFWSKGNHDDRTLAIIY